MKSYHVYPTLSLSNLSFYSGLVREHIPTEKLNSVEVWEALVQKMPMTAMIRNLAKMQTIGLLKGYGRRY